MKACVVSVLVVSPAIALSGSVASAEIIERNGSPFNFASTPTQDVLFPVGEVLESVDRVFNFQFTGQDENGQPISAPASFSIKESVVRELSGTLSFVYEYDTVASTDLPGPGVVEINFITQTGYADAPSNTVDYDLFVAPVAEEPEFPFFHEPIVSWLDDDVIRTVTDSEDYLRSYVIRTNATEYDETGLMSVSFESRVANGPYVSAAGDLTSTVFSPTSAVPAVPLPPAAVPGALTIAGLVATSIVRRRKR